MADPKDPADIADEDFDIAAFSDGGSGDAPDADKAPPSEGDLAQPAPQSEGAPAPEPQQDRGDLNVALSESRQELRELKEKLLEQQGMYKQLMELVQQPRQEAPKEPEKPKEPDDPRPEVPNFNEVGLEEFLAAQHKLQLWHEREQQRQKARQDEQEKTFREFIERQQQMQQRAQQGNQLSYAIAQQEQEFTREVPEYLDALRFLEQNMVEDLMVENFLPREQAVDIARQDMIARAERRMADGGNVPAMIYALARRRGFGAQQQQPAAPAQAGGVAGAVLQQQKKTASEAARAEAALSGATGAPAPGNSLQALIEADEGELLTGQADMMKMLRGG